MLICLQVSPQHEDIQTSTQKPKPAARRRKGQRVLAVQHRGKHNSAKGGVCCGGTAASVCSQHQCRTSGTSILHYGMQRRNIRPLAMVGTGKNENGATNVENCKQWQCPSSHTKNNPREVPIPPPASPLRDVVNATSTTVPPPGSVGCRPTPCSAVSPGSGRDKPGLAQPLRSGTQCIHLKGREDPNEYLFSLTEVTLLQLSQLSSQLPRPGTVPISPLLSSSPLPKAPSEKPSTPHLCDEQPKKCQDANHHNEAIEAQDGCASACTHMPLSNTASTPQPMETPNPQRLHQVKVQEDCGIAKGLVVHELAPATVQLPGLSVDDAARGTGDGCDEPSITDSLAAIMHCLDFDLSTSFQAMQISNGEWPGLTTICTVRDCMPPLTH